MSYLFDPDNWEWLTTGNNLRFLLEGFLVNIEIAAISRLTRNPSSRKRRLLPEVSHSQLSGSNR